MLEFLLGYVIGAGSKGNPRAPRSVGLRRVVRVIFAAAMLTVGMYLLLGASPSAVVAAGCPTTSPWSQMFCQIESIASELGVILVGGATIGTVIVCLFIGRGRVD